MEQRRDRAERQQHGPGGGDGRRQRQVSGELVIAALAGEIRLVAGSYAPDGWYACDGSLRNIDDDVELFNVIGTMYGGDGTTTFALPDLRSQLPVHASLGQAGQ